MRSFDRGAVFGACGGRPPRGRGDRPTVGDFVLLDWREDGESRILETLPRRTRFSRRDPSSSGHGEQAVAANFDYVFILQPLGSGFRPRGLERYLSLAWQSGAVPAVLLTKADAVEDFTDQLRAAEKLAAGTGVFAVSARTGYGLDQLADYLKPGRTVVFLGPSGAGKSTQNALAGRSCAPPASAKGRAGSTRPPTASCSCWKTALAIDTPGMRELGMWRRRRNFAASPTSRSTSGTAGSAIAATRGAPAARWRRRSGAASCPNAGNLPKLREESRLSGSKADFPEKQRRQKSLRPCGSGRRRTTAMSPAESFTARSVAPVTPGTPEPPPQPLSPLPVERPYDNRPGDRASFRGHDGFIGVWVRKDGEWALIHRCRACGALSSNRIAADDNPALLMSIAVKPLAEPPFPLWQAAPEKP
ncbi:MAG: GTPase RsgA [Anaerotruncus massiliensis (ex Togo et al. 2019)]